VLFLFGVQCRLFFLFAFRSLFCFLFSCLVKPFFCRALLLFGLVGCCFFSPFCSLSDSLSVSLSVNVSCSCESRECSLGWFVCWSISLFWYGGCFMFCVVEVLVVLLVFVLGVGVVMVLFGSLSVSDCSITSSASLSDSVSCISLLDDSESSDSSPSYFVSGGLVSVVGFGGSRPVMCSLHWASVMLEWKDLLVLLYLVLLCEFVLLVGDSCDGGVGGVVFGVGEDDSLFVF
jgi:hypothetical protein